MAFFQRSDWRTELIATIGVAGLLALLFRLEQQQQGQQLQRQQLQRGADNSFKDGEGPSAEPAALQRVRATETGRGRNATSPTAIPWAGWKDIFWRVYNDLQDHRLLAVAAGVVFFSLLAIVPAITAFVSFYGLFADTKTINDHLAFAASVMPQSAFEIVADQVTRIAGNHDGKLTFAFLAGLVIAIWSANAAMKALFDGLNVVYDEQEKRGFIKLNLISLGFTGAGLVVLLLAIGAIVVFPLVFAAFGAGFTEKAVALLRWPALAIVMALALAMIYRFGPSRNEAKWRWVTIGSVFASLTWLIGSAGFSWYLANFANYNATYGSLGAIIGLMTWMWLSAVVVLLGAEINAEIEHQTARDSTLGTEKPLGARGAVMADTVGAAS